MSNAEKLVNDPRVLWKLLYSKYGDIREDYQALYLDSLIYSKKSHLFCRYKDYLIWDFVDEFLKRFYLSNECLLKIPRMALFYKNYIKFFCNPFFRDFKINQIIQSFGENKAEIYYKYNYCHKNKKPENCLDYNINSLNEEEEALFKNKTQVPEISQSKTIFNSSVRNNIEKNIITETHDKSTLALQSSQSDLESKVDFLTKRSKDESLLNILHNMGHEIGPSQVLITQIKSNARQMQETGKALKKYKRENKRISLSKESKSPNPQKKRTPVAQEIIAIIGGITEQKPSHSTTSKDPQLPPVSSTKKTPYCNLYKAKPWMEITTQHAQHSTRSRSKNNIEQKTSQGTNDQPGINQGSPHAQKTSRINEFRINKPKNTNENTHSPNEICKLSSFRKHKNDSSQFKCMKQANISSNLIGMKGGELPVELVRNSNTRNPNSRNISQDKKMAIVKTKTNTQKNIKSSLQTYSHSRTKSLSQEKPKQVWSRNEKIHSSCPSSIVTSLRDSQMNVQNKNSGYKSGSMILHSNYVSNVPMNGQSKSMDKCKNTSVNIQPSSNCSMNDIHQMKSTCSNILSLNASRSINGCGINLNSRNRNNNQNLKLQSNTYYYNNNPENRTCNNNTHLINAVKGSNSVDNNKNHSNVKNATKENTGDKKNNLIFSKKSQYDINNLTLFNRKQEKGIFESLINGKHEGLTLKLKSKLEEMLINHRKKNIKAMLDFNKIFQNHVKSKSLLKNLKNNQISTLQRNPYNIQESLKKSNCEQKQQMQKTVIENGNHNIKRTSNIAESSTRQILAGKNEAQQITLNRQFKK